MKYYAVERKKEFLLEMESIMLSEISQVMKVKYHMLSPIIGA